MADKIQHEKDVDTIVRAQLFNDHIAEINEFDVRQRTVKWGVAKSQRETNLLQSRERQFHGCNFRDICIKKRGRVEPEKFSDTNGFLNHVSSDDEYEGTNNDYTSGRETKAQTTMK